MNKTLIINGSPRTNGSTAALAAELRKYLDGEVVELSAFRSNIAPCVDCRRCRETAVCAVKDDMSVIYSDDFDNVVLASPVYFNTLPGPVLGLLSRFQPQHAAAFFLNKPIALKPKKAGLILTAGGNGNESGAEHHIRVLFMLLNAHGYDGHKVMSLKTDTIPAESDADALREARELALWLNKPLTQELLNESKKEYKLVKE
jgi:multimeric flavodoxin WrbA